MAGAHQTSSAVMKPLAKLFKKLQAFVKCRENRTSILPQREIVPGQPEEEEFSYQTTRCLPSYYSIFVARLAIMVMLAILIGMLTMLTWHFTKVYTTNSINSLAYGLRYELLQRPILRVWNILNSTVEITMAQVKLSEYVIGRYEKPLAEEQVELYQMMRDVTWALFSSRTALNSVTISYRNGFVQAFHRDLRSNTTFYIYCELVNSSVNQGKAHRGHIHKSRDKHASAIWYRERLDPVTGEKKGDRKQIPPDDLIKIAGLQEVRDGAASWRVNVGKFTDSPLLSAALPVRHPSGGSIVAAVGVTTALKSVGQLMKELVDFHSGYMYLTSLEGYVLATSTDAPLLRNTTGRKLMMATDLEDHIIRSGAEWLQRAYGNKFPINHEVHAENVLLGNQRYYIDSFFLNLKRLPLVGAIIIPRKYIMGKVDHIGFTTLVILISASICFLAIGCVCILILTSGVSKAMKLKAELISHLDARRRAEASSNYKSRFLANMSHELRTPMAAVIGLLDILIYDNCLTNEQFATVTQIRKCSTALLRLLNNILDLSKVESGKLVLEEAEFDLGRELEGLVDMFSVQCINHNVETTLDLSDDMPKVVRGDSARIVQIFTNLISNSIKFTSEGHIILRGWCDNSNHSSRPECPEDQKMSQCTLRNKSKQHENIVKKEYQKNEKITLWFEVEDTGCGIDPSKWESVFESFEQADPSTTRMHGGTGLGLCIVRNLVNKMGGEIKVVKKDGQGTLIQLYLVLGMSEDCTINSFQTEFGKYSLKVLLALHGKQSRSIMSQWLRGKGVLTWEASEWNGLTQILQHVFQGNMECSTSEPINLSRMRVVPGENNVHKMGGQDILIVVDISLLDQSTNIWNQQLIFLDQYSGKAKFAWMLSHDTSNAIKVELRRRRHFLMINKPLYKTKMTQIMHAAVNEGNFENQEGSNQLNSTMDEDLHESHDLDSIHFDAISSDVSDISDTDNRDSKINTFYSEEEIIERIPGYHQPSYSNSRKISTQRVSLDKIIKKPNILLETENLINMSKDFTETDKHGGISMEYSCCYEYKQDHKKNMIGSITDNLQDNKTRAAVGNKDALLKLNQLHDGGESKIEQECQWNVKPTLYDKGDIKQKMMAETSVASSGNTHAEGMEKQLSTERSIELGYRGSRLLENQDMHYSVRKNDCVALSTIVPDQDSLGGLCILLAEDNPILQRIATAMLEKKGAKVIAVGDGMQAVDAIKCMLCAEESKRQNSTLQDGVAEGLSELQKYTSFDLVLMDCQMPKLDGYEATKAIRNLEAGTGLHIPIVAVTAHAMSSDEAKCLEVGMDAYLTKPIDSKLMVSTILSLTKRDV
ncbi:histidine kinase 1-like [Phoenix dactylifera]|uniref:histidine kinase n=1 Tax=Phoenix dactylifera TaxID=42345 RepID=A0A8B7MWT2_PHODC|nr:histidine kinase 1-like [Phoenix dactylifera]